MKIAVFGAGAVGSRLSKLLTHAGHEIELAQRSPDKTTGPSFARAAQWADLVVLAVPYSALDGLLPPLAEALAGKVVVDCSNPLNADWSPMLLGQENSAGESVARLLPSAHVVKAFNTVFADVMLTERLERGGRCVTAFVAGDHAAAKANVAALAKAIGFAPVDVGPLRMARYLEAMAHLNIQIAVGQGGGTNAAFLYDQVRA
jgi:8-hydroxy-5-deazaflavin:NADPH oxidoreductase